MYTFVVWLSRYACYFKPKKKNQICFIKMNLITDFNYLFFFFKLVIKIVRKINVHQSIKFWYTYWIKRTKDNSYIMWCKCYTCIMNLINSFCRICEVYAESVCVFVFILPSIWLINLWSRVQPACTEERKLKVRHMHDIISLFIQVSHALLIAHKRNFQCKEPIFLQFK